MSLFNTIAMKAIVDYLKANAIADWGVVSERQVMKDTLCEYEDIEKTLSELQSNGWKFIHTAVIIGGVTYKMIEFEIN